MKKLLFLIILIHFPTFSEVLSPLDMFPFADKAGSTNTTAISKSDPSLIGWADGYTGISYGPGVTDNWKTPQKALGPATGNALDVVCLGDGGQITMTFFLPIIDGEGFDFAIFENGFSSTFLELAWVEVSSDGTHFVRFPNYYAGIQPISNSHDPTYIYGLASKYKAGYGHPFDLNELQEAYDEVLIEQPAFFSDDYTTQLTNNFPHLDLNNIRYVRLIDIVGDGSANDTEGYTIYDPYPTSGSAGFDLEAVGVINRQSVSGAAQTITFPTIPNQKLSTGHITLHASSDSSLPVSYTVLDGPATIDGNQLTFTNTGEIVIQAIQTGNGTYAPADPITRSFHVAEKLQHIWIEPIPNLIANSGSWQIQATANSGLPVYLEIASGPYTAYANPTTHLLFIGSATGTVQLRATQSGNETYAPAEDITIEFDIVESGATNASQTFAEWSANADAPQLFIQASINQYAEPVMQFTFASDRRMLGRTLFQSSGSLTDNWSNAIPEIVSCGTTNNQTLMNVHVPIDESRKFYRLLLEENAE